MPRGCTPSLPPNKKVPLAATSELHSKLRVGGQWLEHLSVCPNDIVLSKEQPAFDSTPACC